MLRTFSNLVTAPIGFDPAGLQTARVAISFRQYPDVPSRWAFHRDLLTRIGQLPGVTRVSAASPLPFAPLQDTRRYGRDGDASTALSLATQQTALPGYLGLVKTHLREGRDFTEHDITTQAQVVIVDERIARQLWPEGALGKRLLVESGQKRRSMEVVGVTNAVRSKQVRDERTPHLFVPYHIYPIELSLVIETGLSTAAIAPAIERTVAAMGTGRAVFDVRSMSDRVEESFGDTRFTMLVLVGFAAAALTLAAIGLYGTLSYLISQRLREFGVRAALGASVRQLMGLVMRQGLIMSAVGAALGLAGALIVTRAMAGLLYGVQPFDALTLFAVAAAVILVALIAAARPAWRASRVDFSLVLRSE
jgi:putative ABC transport system permease protein